MAMARRVEPWRLGEVSSRPEVGAGLQIWTSRSDFKSEIRIWLWTWNPILPEFRISEFNRVKSGFRPSLISPNPAILSNFINNVEGFSMTSERKFLVINSINIYDFTIKLFWYKLPVRLSHPPTIDCNPINPHKTNLHSLTFFVVKSVL